MKDEGLLSELKQPGFLFKTHSLAVVAVSLRPA